MAANTTFPNAQTNVTTPLQIFQHVVISPINMTNETEFINRYMVQVTWISLVITGMRYFFFPPPPSPQTIISIDMIDLPFDIPLTSFNLLFQYRRNSQSSFTRCLELY